MTSHLSTSPPRLALTLTLVAAALVACTGEPTPAYFEAGIAPSRTWYATGQTVELQGFVTDAARQPIDGVAVVWTVEPQSAASAGAPHANPARATFTLEQEGPAVFTGCVVPKDEGATPFLCDTVAVRVDDGMPIIELETPWPGAELDDPEGIVVRGSVSDRSMVRVYANGQPAEVDSLGRFETTLEASFGVNHVVVSASDGLTDARQLEMDVLWAVGFSDAVGEDGTPESVLDDGLSLWLGQNFFDDGQPLDPAAVPLETRDLADLLELVVGSVDITGLIPDPVVDSGPNFTLRVTEPALSDVTAELDLTAEGADLFLRIGRLSARTSGALMIDSTSLPLTGTVEGSAVAFARILIRKDGEDAELEVSLADLTVGIESMEGDFVSDETDAVFLLVEGLFRTTLEAALLDAVRGTMEESVPAVLRDALGAVDGALADQQIPLNSPPFPAVTIQIDGGIRDLRTTFRGEMLATLRTTVGTATPVTHPESRGIARLDLLPTAPRFYRDGSLKLGVRLAMLNGLLHGLWNSGLLDVDASPLLPEGIQGLVSEARIVGRIAPVLRPPTSVETDDLVLAVGQLELELLFMGQPVTFGVSLEAGVDIDLRNNHLAINLSHMPNLHVWTIVAPRDPRLLSAETVSDLLIDLWPTLRESVAGGLAFDLPLPGLGDLGGLAPDLADLALRVDMTERVRPRRGVLVLDAQMTGAFPM